MEYEWLHTLMLRLRFNKICVSLLTLQYSWSIYFTNKYITRQNKMANLLQNRGDGYMKILHFSSIFNLPSKHQSTSHYTIIQHRFTKESICSFCLTINFKETSNWLMIKNHELFIVAFGYVKIFDLIYQKYYSSKQTLRDLVIIKKMI